MTRCSLGMVLAGLLMAGTPCVSRAVDQPVIDQINAAVAVLSPSKPARAQIKPADAAKVDGAIPTSATTKPKKHRKVLVWVRATKYIHTSIGLGAYAVVEMGKKTGAYEAVVSNDLSSFEPENLKQFDAVILCNTTGDWIEPEPADMAKLSSMGKDREQIAAGLRKSLLDFVNHGGGLAGFHSATDANYHWPEFPRLIGGWFKGHPWHTGVTVKLVDPSSPLLAPFDGKGFDVTDEIYLFRNYDPTNVHELLALDTSKPYRTHGGTNKPADKDFPIAWIRRQGNGRVFYSSLGHEQAIYWNAAVMKFYLNGFQYVLGDLNADATPGR